MRKALLIAIREYKAMVATKAFLIGIAVLPVFMLGGMLVPALLRGRTSEAKKVVVVEVKPRWVCETVNFPLNLQVASIWE